MDAQSQTSLVGSNVGVGFGVDSITGESVGRPACVVPIGPSAMMREVRELCALEGRLLSTSFSPCGECVGCLCGEDEGRGTGALVGIEWQQPQPSPQMLSLKKAPSNAYQQLLAVATHMPFNISHSFASDHGAFA